MNQSIRNLRLAVRSALQDDRNSAQMIYDAFYEVVKAEKVTAETVATKTRDALSLLESTKVPDYLSSPTSWMNSGDTVIYGGDGCDTISFDVSK